MALFQADAKRYINLMKQLSQTPVATAAKIAVGVALLAAATGLAFASWIDKGAGIFMATVEAGLAWCF
jgi:putative flippase GtrA